MTYQYTRQRMINGISLLLILFSFTVTSAHADDCLLDTNGDGNADTNIDTDGGANSQGNNFRLACGHNASATGTGSTAVGTDSSGDGNYSTGIGRLAKGNSKSMTALGYAAGANGNVVSTTSPSSIVIGNFANIKPNSPGAIAIGATDGPDLFSSRGAEAGGENAIAIGFEAKADAPGAIALGANVVADVANTMMVGTPIRIIRDDGISQLRIIEKIAGNSVKTLFNLICDTCTPGFRFNQILPSNNTWFFRMLQSGNFSVDDPATMTKEAEFRSGGDLKIGGTLIQASSREIKTDFIELDNSEILNKIDQLPITQWSYKKDQGNVTHIGPMAEDFYALFDVGLNNKGLSSVDTAGVALAAIKALKSENDQLKIRISELESQSSQLAELKQLVTQLVNAKSETRIAQISY